VCQKEVKKAIVLCREELKELVVCQKEADEQHELVEWP
jgi:hypothetical protein